MQHKKESIAVFHHAATDIIVELSDHSNTGVLKAGCRCAVVCQTTLPPWPGLSTPPIFLLEMQCF